MFKQIDGVLPPQALAELNRIADSARFADGRISNPHNIAKNNRHLHDPQANDASARIMSEALFACEDFRNFAFPKRVAPPLITSYQQAMRYGVHVDAPFMQIGRTRMRSDLSCTIFLTPPEDYEGGVLRVHLGTATVEVKGQPGSLILYPSNTLHEVTPVTRGDRRVGLTFIESQIADPIRREWLYELNEVAALEGLKMSHENYTRLQRVQVNLLRDWSDHE